MRFANLIALVVVAAGALIAINILRSPDTKNTAIPDALTITSGNSANELDYKKIIDQVTKETITTETANAAEFNLTEDLGLSYASKIAGENSRDIFTAVNINKLRIPEEDMIEKLADEKIAETYLYTKSFSKNELRTIPTDNNESKITYITQISEATKKHIDPLKYGFIELADNWISSQDTTGTAEYTSAVTDLITALLATKAPQSLADFHLELINNWQKKLLLAEALHKTAEDPLKAYLAFTEAHTLLEKDLALQEEAEKILSTN